MKRQEVPVFFDGSGKRWRIFKVVCVALAIGAAGTAYWLIPHMVAHKPVSPLPMQPQQSMIASVPKSGELPRPASLSFVESTVNQTNVPVIGQGPLVRVIRLHRTGTDVFAVEPFTSEVLGLLSRDDVRRAGRETFALQRYGALPNNRIALTFDDGPDEVFTTQLLNVLSEESAPASFFVNGRNVIRYPEVTDRIIAEGHTVANHTFFHVDFDYIRIGRGQQEINQTQRVISAATGTSGPFYRPPYAGNTNQGLRDSVRSILVAQQMGYTVTSYDFDTDDWKFSANRKREYPDFSGAGIVVLLHDGGGNRSGTIGYVRELIRKAKAKGYTFVSLDAAYRGGKEPVAVSAAPTVADRASFMAWAAVLIWPRLLVGKLFLVSVVLLMVTTVLNIVLALLQRRRAIYRRKGNHYQPSVTVIVPAYNEGKVLEATVRSLLRSYYRGLRILIVDDGSTDDTRQVAQRLARRSKRVTAISQRNGGKAAALNRGIRVCKSEIVICVDADTVFQPQTVTRLVRHFQDPAVGAVAGVVKVGNIQNVITKWQSMEYMIGINIERNAQAYMDAIMIVPGACGAWRKKAVIAAGGFSHSTLAEDCDLTMGVQRAGYKILQDNQAVSFTESPLRYKSLFKQRFRWTFGNVQSLWKHRDMMFRRRYGMLGMFVMPQVVVSIMIPMLFWPLLVVIAVENIVAGNYAVMLAFFLLSLSIQLTVAAIGTRIAREKSSHLWVVIVAKFTFSPMRTYILYNTFLTVIRGAHVGWNKLARTGTVNYRHAAAGRAVAQASET